MAVRRGKTRRTLITQQYQYLDAGKLFACEGIEGLFKVVETKGDTREEKIHNQCRYCCFRGRCSSLKHPDCSAIYRKDVVHFEMVKDVSS